MTADPSDRPDDDGDDAPADADMVADAAAPDGNAAAEGLTATLAAAQVLVMFEGMVADEERVMSAHW
jgi:hypothetical protein